MFFRIACLLERQLFEIVYFIKAKSVACLTGSEFYRTLVIIDIKVALFID